MFVPYASENLTKSYGPTTRNLALFDKNRVFYNHFWQRVDIILEDVSVAEIIFNATLLI